MATENAVLNRKEQLNDESTDTIDFDELEDMLQSQLDEDFADMQVLADEKDKIENPDALGEIIGNVVWEQFMNQVAAKAGEDFIEENRGLTLDLLNSAHIQNTKDFEEGKIAKHNTEIDYQQRYDDYMKNFYTDPDNYKYKGTKGYMYNKRKGVWEKYDNRSKSYQPVLKDGYRDPYDKNRPKGTKTVNIDEVVPVAEQVRDPAANAHLTEEERVKFDNSDVNLTPMDSAANQSKGDSETEDWLNSENKEGKKPADRFPIDEEELRNKDTAAREEYERLKEEGEKRSKEAGKKSQRQEAIRITGKALRSAVMQLFAEFVREIIAKLVGWLKSAKKALNTLLDSMKEAIHSFIKKLKPNLINAGHSVVSTIVAAIIGPVFGTIQKVWMLLKQGWNSLKEAINYLRDPSNKGKSMGIRLMEVGKIVIAGLTAGGSLLLGEVIEKGLMAVPGFAFDIPLFGSLANFLGILLGAIVSGIIGAIAINLIDRLIANKQKQEVQEKEIEKGNQILVLQKKREEVNKAHLESVKSKAEGDIVTRHLEAGKVMQDACSNIMENNIVGDSPESVNKQAIDDDDIKIIQTQDESSNDLNGLMASMP